MTNWTGSSRRLLERRPDIKLLFLVGSCPSEVIKLDLSRAAARLSPQLCAATCGCSTIPAAASRRRSRRARMPASRRWSRRCRAKPTAEPPLLVVGALADVVEDQFARLFAALGIGPVRFLPAAPRDASRRSAPDTGFLLAQPFLADTARALEDRGAQRHRRAFPARRRRARRRGCGPRPTPSASRPRASTRSPPRPRSGPTRALARYRAAAGGQAGVPSSPILSSKSRWRASWRANWGCGRSRSARPTCIASILAQELALLPHGSLLSEGQDVDRAARPLPRSCARTWWSAASAWPIRWRPRA